MYRVEGTQVGKGSGYTRGHMELNIRLYDSNVSIMMGNARVQARVERQARNAAACTLVHPTKSLTE